MAGITIDIYAQAVKSRALWKGVGKELLFVKNW